MAWAVTEGDSGYLPDVLPVIFTQHADAVMYAEEIAKAFAVLYGDPNTRPIIAREGTSRWIVAVNPTEGCGEFQVIEVVEL